MKDILKKIGISFKEEESLARHTSFRTGGNAKLFAEPSDRKQLIDLLKEVKSKDIPFFIMGNGTNLLAPDEGFDGVVISLGDKFSHIGLLDDRRIKADAGALLSKIGRFAASHGLSGFEFAHGIPGSLGGGVYMNAGAYGGELCNIITKVEYLDENLELQSIPCEEAKFGYRDSIFKHNKEWIVTGAEFLLTPKDKDEIEAVMRDLAQRRRDKQPLEYPSAGSTFKRPEGYYAAKLIEDCGLKGKRAGGACVSPKHAGFLINIGGATTADVLELMDIVRKTVFDKTGVELHAEVEKMRPFGK